MNQAGWRRFIKLCLTIKNEKMFAILLDLFLTPEERESIATRLLIVLALLEQKKSQREIAEALHVSIAKITRGSNELKHTPAQLIALLKKYI